MASEFFANFNKVFGDFKVNAIAGHYFRQADGKDRPARLDLAAARMDLAMMEVDNAPDQGQPQPAALRTAGVRASIQLFENLGNILHRNATA